MKKCDKKKCDDACAGCKWRRKLTHVSDCYTDVFDCMKDTSIHWQIKKYR